MTLQVAPDPAPLGYILQHADGTYAGSPLGTPAPSRAFAGVLKTQRDAMDYATHLARVTGARVTVWTCHRWDDRARDAIVAVVG